MMVPSVAHRLQRSLLQAHRSVYLYHANGLRTYASQATAQQRPPTYSSSSSSAPASPSSRPRQPPARGPIAPASDSKDASSRASADSELGSLIQRMMHSRKRHTRRLDSADEVAAELDRMSGDQMAQRQGALLDRRLADESNLDMDILNIGRRTSRLPPLPPPVRCDAYVSRGEAVGKGVTLARALEKLSIKLAVNKVRPHVRMQRFHERPGLKRKRLKSERWRKNFKQGFVATVKKVQKMVKKGW